MKIIEKNKGDKIAYDLMGGKIIFDDEILINLKKYERDDPAKIDICRDKQGRLINGVIPGLTENYVAEIEIPAKEYTYKEVEAEEMQMGESTQIKEPVPFDVNKCTLTLWAL